MELSNIIELIHAVSDSNLTQFNLQDGNLNISMSAEKTIVQQAAAKATEAVSASVAANRARPRENGSQAATLATNDPRNMTKEERAALRKRIYAAAYNGEKLPLGG